MPLLNQEFGLEFSKNRVWSKQRLGPHSLRLAQLNDQDSSLKLEFPLAHVATVATTATGQRRPSSVAQVLGSSPALKAAEEWETWVRHAEIVRGDVPLAEGTQGTYSFDAILVSLNGFDKLYGRKCCLDHDLKSRQ